MNQEISPGKALKARGCIGWIRLQQQARRDERRAQAEQQAGEIVRKAREDAAREHERVMEQAKGEISELMSAAAEKLVLSSTSDAYDKFLDTAEERKDNG